MFSRREFLKYGTTGLSALALRRAVPSVFAQAAKESAAADRNDRVLVVIELTGGNDGLNTAIPFEDDRYYENRPTLSIGRGDVIKLSDEVGLHPRLAPLGELYRQGKVAAIRGVGYPQPDRSHFRSMEIWHTASTDAKPPNDGWLGRYLDGTTQSGTGPDLRGLALTGELPQALRAERVVVPVASRLDALPAADATPKARLRRQLIALPGESNEEIGFLRGQATIACGAAEQLRKAATQYRSTVQYPSGELGPQLQRAAQIIAADVGARVLFASQGGYDTHAAQADVQANLLGELAAALAAFQSDLTALKVADRTTVFVFSEFGRRVEENASLGTDHGAASCSFLIGAKVNGGLAGRYPSLESLDEGDLIYTTDFRSVYATLLEEWLGCPSEKLLGGKFATLSLFQKRG
jgi:uncharacterized protein (DUF1501 family)